MPTVSRMLFVSRSPGLSRITAVTSDAVHPSPRIIVVTRADVTCCMEKSLKSLATEIANATLAGTSVIEYRLVLVSTNNIT